MGKAWLNGSVFDSSWPVFGNNKAEGDTTEIVAQINSRNKCKLIISNRATEEEIRMQALAQREIAAELEGRKVQRIIYVKTKFINIVVL